VNRGWAPDFLLRASQFRCSKQNVIEIGYQFVCSYSLSVVKKTKRGTEKNNEGRREEEKGEKGPIGKHAEIHSIRN
jgi:hypothetical protein